MPTPKTPICTYPTLKRCRQKNNPNFDDNFHFFFTFIQFYLQLCQHIVDGNFNEPFGLGRYRGTNDNERFFITAECRGDNATEPGKNV